MCLLCGFDGLRPPFFPPRPPSLPPKKHTHKTHSRLVAVIASFGALKPKAAFRFVARACPGYATGPLLAHLKDAGMCVFFVCAFSWWFGVWVVGLSIHPPTHYPSIHHPPIHPTSQHQQASPSSPSTPSSSSRPGLTAEGTSSPRLSIWWSTMSWTWATPRRRCGYVGYYGSMGGVMNMYIHACLFFVFIYSIQILPTNITGGGHRRRPAARHARAPGPGAGGVRGLPGSVPGAAGPFCGGDGGEGGSAGVVAAGG